MSHGRTTESVAFHHCVMYTTPGQPVNKHHHLIMPSYMLNNMLNAYYMSAAASGLQSDHFLLIAAFYMAPWWTIGSVKHFVLLLHFYNVPDEEINNALP